MIRTIKEELREFLRDESPLTAFARGCKNEGAGDAAASTGKENALAALTEADLDELPESMREVIKKARGEFTTLQTTATETETRRVKAEKFAREQQSRADQLDGVVRKHNLGDAPPSVAVDPQEKEIFDRFIRDGLPEVQAKAYTKMFVGNNEIFRKSFLAELGPLASTVGSIQADQVLSATILEHSNLFAIPEVSKSVRDNVAILVQQGNPVTPETVKHLTSMAYGTYMMQPGAKPAVKQGEVPTFGSAMSNGSVVAPRKTSDGSPIAREPETLGIISALNGFMRQGLPSKTK